MSAGKDIQRDGQPVPVQSDDWTGGPNTDLGRTKLDDWVDSHPFTSLAAGIFLLAVVSTAQVVGHASVSLLGKAETFAFALVAYAAVYGSAIGGVLLFAKLTGRIERATIDHLTTSQKRYLFGLLAVLFFVSMWMGPIAVGKLLAFVRGHG